MTPAHLGCHLWITFLNCNHHFAVHIDSVAGEGKSNSVKGHLPAGMLIMALHCADFRRVLILVMASSSSLACSGAGTPTCQAAAPRPSTARRPMF